MPAVVHRPSEHVPVAIRRLTDEQVLPLVLSRTRAGRGIELEKRITALGVVHQHHATAADAAHLRVDHALHEGARDGGVHGVSATPHDLEANLGCLRLRADDDGHGPNLDQPPTSKFKLPVAVWPPRRQLIVWYPRPCAAGDLGG